MIQNRMLHIAVLTVLMAVPVACHPQASPTTANVGMKTQNLRVTSIIGEPRAVVLKGPWTFERQIENCTYQHPDWPAFYWLQISWGDGAVSDLLSGPFGGSCADIKRHTYSMSGRYLISVKISGLGPADGPLPIYDGATVVIINE